MNNCIIVLNYNDFNTTLNLVSKIKDYSNIDKIIVVDNCSTNNSFEELSKIANNKIDVIKTEQNLGYAYGNNYGAYYALKMYNPKFLIIANPDIMFNSDIIDILQNKLTQNNRYAMITAKMRNEVNAWKLPTFMNTIESMFLIKQKISGKSGYYKEKNLKSTDIVDVVSGSFFIIKSDIFEEIKGFDERTFLYCEENILGYKLKEKGYYTLLDNSCYYDHFHSVTIKKVYKSKVKPFKIYYESLKVYNKYYLKLSKTQNIFFKIAYIFALIERIIYNFVFYIFNFIK